MNFRTRRANVWAGLYVGLVESDAVRADGGADQMDSLRTETED